MNQLYHNLKIIIKQRDVQGIEEGWRKDLASEKISLSTSNYSDICLSN